MNNTNCSARNKLLRKIQKHSFALVEAHLFLDGHPNCQRALEYFTCQKEMLDRYVAEYEETYGPLTARSGACNDSWKWIQGPWPWEREAN